MRLRRRYSILGGVAAALLVAGLTPLLQTGDKAKTNVEFANQPTTLPTDATDATDGTDTTMPPVTSTSGVPVVTSPPTDTQPLFARISDKVVIVSHYDGTARRVVKADASGFVWSPHRTRLLIAAANELVVFDAASGRVTTIARVPATETMWARRPWSPDDTRVTFTTGGSARVYDVTTKTTREIPSEGTWSPNGKWIAYSDRRSENSELFVFSPDGGKPKPIATDVGAWAWSPDSQSLAFGGYYGTSFGAPQEPDKDKPLRVAPIDGSGSRAFPHTPPDTESVVVDLSWSPDGRFVLVYRRTFRHDTTTTCPCPVGGDASVGVLNVGVGTWRDFDKTGMAWNSTSTGAITSDGRLTPPRVEVRNPWTADSTAVFLAGPYLQPIDGSAGRRISSSNSHFLPSPDRTAAVFNCDDKRCVVDFASGAETTIAMTWGFVDDWLDWAPDGTVFFVRDPNTKDFVVIGRDGRVKARFS